MNRLFPAALLLALGFASGAAAQIRTRRSDANPTASTGGYKAPAATMHGVLHRLTSKEVVIITDGEESVSIVRTHKTKFLRDGKEIKPSEIAMGSIVSVDVGHFPDLSPQAVNVMVDSPPIEGEAPTAAKSQPSAGEMDKEEPAEASAAPAAKAAEKASGPIPNPPDAKPAAAAKSQPAPAQMDQEEPPEASPDPKPAAKPEAQQSR